jgi:hypothetical protein
MRNTMQGIPKLKLAVNDLSQLPCSIFWLSALFVPTPRTPHFTLHDDVISVNLKNPTRSDNNFSFAEVMAVLQVEPENSR